MKKKISVITGSRADYGHLQGLIREIYQDKDLELQLVVTGMHLSKKHGLTYKMITKDKFPIRARVNILKFDDTREGVIKAVGLGCQLFADEFKRLKPDLVLVLGDRYEIWASAIAAYLLRIPIVHIHGGETSQGSFDEGIRHSITKLATFHFAATEKYRKRIIQMGENPARVFNFGAPGLDDISQLRFLSKQALEKKLNFRFHTKTAIFTYHPATLDEASAVDQVKNILNVIRASSFQVVFTAANADPQGIKINNLVQEFCGRDNKKYKFVYNLGKYLFYSCLKNCDVMIGNSSSGIVEAPSFKLPVVNIGDRQKNRMKAENVIDCDGNSLSIKKAIKTAISNEFKRKIRDIKNPYLKYSDGKVSYRIKEKLKSFPLNESILKKKFFDLP